VRPEFDQAHPVAVDSDHIGQRDLNVDPLGERGVQIGRAFGSLSMALFSRTAFSRWSLQIQRGRSPACCIEASSAEVWSILPL